MPIPPSGRQYPISHADQAAVVTEVGAGLRTYVRGDWTVLDGYREDEMCRAARGAALIPWPNRLQDGHYEFGGEAFTVPLSEPERHNAIHGLTRWLNWEARRHRGNEVVMGLVLHPREGYPFTLDLEIAYRLDESGLQVSTTARNLGDRPLPFGTGHHPYVRVGTEAVDQAWLRLPAGTRLETDVRQNATGRRIEVAGTPYDFRSGRPIGDLPLDTAFADLDRDPDGRARIVVRGEPWQLTLWLDAAYAYLMVFTGDSLPAPERRRSLGLEPMTCGPNAFRLPHLGLVSLAPGERFQGSWGLTL